MSYKTPEGVVSLSLMASSGSICSLLTIFQPHQPSLQCLNIPSSFRLRAFALAILFEMLFSPPLPPIPPNTYLPSDVGFGENEQLR